MTRILILFFLSGFASLDQGFCQTSLGRDSVAKILLLSDTAGRLVNLHDFRGKVVVVDFWFTGCGGCAGFYSRVFSPLKAHFKSNDGVVFVSVSTDTSHATWRHSIESNIYTSDDALNLNTGGRLPHPVVDFYQLYAYPSLLVIAKDGQEKVLHGVNGRGCTLEDMKSLIDLELKLR